MLHTNINVSSSDTHYSDSSTCLKVEILLGPGNYTRWLRDFKLAAICKDVLSLIAPFSIAEANREEILTKPVRPTKPDLSPAKYTEGETAAKLELFCTDNDIYQLDIMEYMLDLEMFQKQQKRLRYARTLLFATVTPAVLGSVSDTVVPSEVMAEIKSLCKMSDSY